MEETEALAFPSPLSALRRIAIHILIPLTWRSSRNHTAKALMRFSATEFDSAWQNLHALRSVTDPALRAKMFQHSLEEVHHGILFRRAALDFSASLPAIPAGERRPLYQGRDEREALRAFFGYEYVGERDVSQEFGAYAAAAPFPEIKEIFRRLESDEQGHVRYARDVYFSLEPSRFARAVTVAKVNAGRVRDAWLRLGRLLGEFTGMILLGALYFAFGPWLRGPASRRIQGERGGGPGP